MGCFHPHFLHLFFLSPRFQLPVYNSFMFGSVVPSRIVLGRLFDDDDDGNGDDSAALLSPLRYGLAFFFSFFSICPFFCPFQRAHTKIHFSLTFTLYTPPFFQCSFAVSLPLLKRFRVFFRSFFPSSCRFSWFFQKVTDILNQRRCGRSRNLIILRNNIHPGIDVNFFRNHLNSEV